MRSGRQGFPHRAGSATVDGRPATNSISKGHSSQNMKSKKLNKKIVFWIQVLVWFSKVQWSMTSTKKKKRDNLMIFSQSRS